MARASTRTSSGSISSARPSNNGHSVRPSRPSATRLKPSTSEDSSTNTTTMPGQSSGGRVPVRAWAGMARWAIHSTSTAIGRLAAKIHCQLATTIKSPASGGPSTKAMP
jgi:hypothetical protein